MFAIDPTVYTAYMGTCLLLSITPGTDNIYVLTRTLSQGKSAGFMAALGVALALVIQVVALTMGLSQLFLSAPKLYTAVKYAGVVYLLYLAYRAFFSNGNGAMLATSGDRLANVRIVRQAMTLCLLNPKLAVFYIAFLPQFTDPAGASMAVQLFVLGLTFAVIGLTVFCVAILCIAPIGAALQSSPHFWKWQTRVSGSVLGAMAIWLAIARD